MRHPASEKLEIIRTVEASHLPVRQTLTMLGIPSTTYYRWYDRWSEGGLDALADTAPHPGSVWNRLPDETRADIIEFALEHEDLTPRELAVKYTDDKNYLVSESSVYRILKAEDLITAPAHIVMKAANEFKDRNEPCRAIGPSDNGECGPTSSGRRTSPISRFSAGAGSTCRLSSTTTAAKSSPGSSARR